MALRKQFKTEYDLIVNDAYFKINSMRGTKDYIFIELCIYNEIEGEKKKIKIIDSIDDNKLKFVPNLESNDNFIKQAYVYLKSLDYFQDAVDC